MANRFWVGGSGTWNTTSTTNWSSTSGGASGASVPTAADAVIFDANSGTGTISFANTQTCLSINATGSSLTVGTGMSMTVAGSITTPATFNMTAATGTITLNSPSTLTFGTACGSVNFVINTTVTTSVVQFGAAFDCGSVVHQQGTITTNNNTWTLNQYTSSGAGTKAMNLGSSTVNVKYASTTTAWDASTLTTLNAGTSTISFRAGSTSYGITFGSKTYYNVNFGYLPGTNNATVISTQGANTFNNLTLNAGASAPNTVSYTWNNTQTITGTFATSGTSPTNRVIVGSTIANSTRTIIAAAVSLSDIDFQDITASGAATPFTGTRIGNLGNNSNITFSTPKTVYWNLAGAQNWSATAWASTSGGAPNVNNFPLAQDTAIFDNTGAAGTVTSDILINFPFPSVDFSARTNAMTFNLRTNDVGNNVYGNWTNGSGVSFNAVGGILTFSNRTAQTLSGNGVAFPNSASIIIDSITGTTTLQSAVTVGGTSRVISGTLDLQSYTFSTYNFVSSYTSTRTIAFGTGNITLTGTAIAVWDTTTTTGLTITGTPSVYVTDATAGATSITPGSYLTGVAAFYRTAGTGSFTITSGSTIRGLDFTGFSGPWATTSTTNFGGLVMSTGMTLTGNNQMTFSGTGTSLITSNGKTYVGQVTFSASTTGTYQLTDAFTTTNTATIAAGTLDLNGKTLTCTRFIVSGTGTKNLTSGTGGSITVNSTGAVFDNSAGSNMTTTGDPVVNVTNATATACTVAAGTSVPNGIASFNFTAGTYALTLSGNVKSINFTGWAGSVTLPAMSIYGNFTVPASGGTYSASTSTITFAATSGTKIITTNGRTLDVNMAFDGLGGTWQLAGACTIGAAKTLTLTNGALDLNNFTFTTGFFASDNTNTRSIAFGTTGQITIPTGNTGTAIFSMTSGLTGYSYTGTGKFVCTYNGSLGTRTVNISSVGATQANSPNIYVTAGTDSFSHVGSINDFILTGFSGTMVNTLGHYMYGSLTISATTTVSSSATGITFGASSGTQIITTNGKTLDFPISIICYGATLQLADNLTIGSARTVTYTSGTLDLNTNKVLSCGLFSSATTLARSILFGTSGYITTVSSGTVLSINGTSFTYTGTSRIDVANNSAVATTITLNTAFTETNALNINITTGTYILSETSSPTYGNLNFTGFSGTIPNAVRTVYGSLTISTGMTLTAGNSATTFAGTSGTKILTSNGKTLDFPLIVNGLGSTLQLAANTTVGSGKPVTFTNGTIDLNSFILTAGSFNSNSSGTRTLAFGASGSISITGTTSTQGFQLVAGTYTVTGTAPVVNMAVGTSGITKTMGCGSNLIDFNFTSGTDSLTFITNFSCKNINFTGYSGTVSASGSGGMFIYGNLTLSATMTLPAATTFYLGFYGSSGTSTITNSGKTLDMNIIVDCAGKTIQILDALTQTSTKTFTFYNGTLQLKNGTTNTVGSFLTSGSTLKYLRSTTSGSQATISQASGTVTATYLDIQDSNATGGATFDSSDPTNVNSGNNTGWNFNAAMAASIVESMTATESLDAIQEAFADITESSSVSDYVSVTMEALVTITETSTASDSATVILSTLASITESSTASDIASVSWTTPASITESSTASDVASVSWTTPASITESSTASESSSTSWVTSSNITESSTISDSANAGFVLSAVFNESLTLSEVQSYINVYASAISENLVLSEVIDKQAVFYTNITETTTSSTVQGVQAVFSGQLSESVTASDLQAAVALFNSSVAEQVSASDAISVSAAFSVNIVESSTATATQDRAAIFAASQAETATISESSSKTIAFNVIRDETASIDIIQAAQYNVNVAATEAMHITDSPYAAMYALLELLAAQQRVLSASTYVGAALVAAEPNYISPDVEDSGIQVYAEVIYPTIH